ncbi:MAG TPA: M28 family peptidase [Longimicrobiales bacterium]|nr:M28 family peptidase [Longimicrobiales bacterium]
MSKVRSKIRVGALALLALLIETTAPGRATAQSVLDRAAATITEAEYLERVGVIAHDSMYGRDTPSPGLDKTAAWIASELQSFGVRGGAEGGGFLQRYPLRSLVVDLEASGLTGGARRLAYGADIVPLFGADGGGGATAGLLLVSGTRDLGRAIADNAVRAQHAVLVLPANAPGVDQEALRYAMTLRNAGAASVLVTSNADDASWSADAVRALEPSVARGWEARSVGPGPFRPVLVVRTSALADLLRGTGVDLAALQARGAEPVRVDRVRELTLTLTQRSREEEITAPNVVGILEGSDPALRNEYVVFSAHMDHVGIGTPDQRGDSIFNGADDDASGTIAVVEIAEAMASLPTPPRRSMLFLLVSGEEKGLWGSEYFADNPSVSAEQMVANLNMDMIGRNWPDTIVAIGKEHSDLGATLERVNAAHPELGMTAIDDLWPEQSFYTRSDHYNFAVKGVPVLFFFNGTHADYHGRDDEVDRIDGEKAARIARLVFHLGAEIGNADARPAWNPESYARIVTDRP